MPTYNLRKSLYAASLLLLFGGFAVVPSLQPVAGAQSTIAGDISGTITDSTGAAIPGAQVTVASKTTGQSKTTTTSGTGAYRATLLQPGAYTVTVSAPNFGAAAEDVDVNAGQVTSGDVKLQAGSTVETVIVTDAAPLLKTDAADLTTTFDMAQIQAIPNPGNDLTYYAQTAPGVVMNTGGGSGNFSAFGLPGTSNNFLVNGAQQNDPFLNLNNSGPSNLLLGQNDISEVSVITNAYGAEFGSFGGAQLNEISRSGSNKFHGNAVYYYNGALFNSNDWFSNHDGAPKPNSVNNQWALGVGGPIVKDKSFFFVNTEGIRFIASAPLPTFVPSASYRAGVLATAAAGGDPLEQSANFAGGPDPGVINEVPYLTYLLNLYSNSPGVLAAKASGAYLTNVDSQSDEFEANPKNSLKEYLVTARFDQALGANDHFFMHALFDNGIQPTTLDALNPIFNATSRQPEYSGQLSETHTFSPNISNQFLFTAAHYSALFAQSAYQQAHALLPYTFEFEDESFAPINEDGFAFPEGRNATQYQFQNDISYTRGNHTLKIGGLFKRDDISNLDAGIYDNPLLLAYGNTSVPAGVNTSAAYNGNVCDPNPNNQGYFGPYCFTNGYAFFNRQLFPGGTNQSCIGGACTGVPPSNPIAFYNLGAYFEDVYKALPNLTLTAGIRFEHDSNPVCQTNCFSALSSDISGISHEDGPVSPTGGYTPYNQLLVPGRRQAFKGYTSIQPEPRLGFNWQPLGPGTHTVVSGGFGMFADVFPGQVTDNLLRNPPQNTRFTSENYFQGIQPGAATFSPDGFTSNQQSAALFYGPTGYAAGASYHSLANQILFTRPNVFTPANNIQYPTYEEFNLQVQQQVNRSTSIQIGYVGNHGYHEPTIDSGKNAYNRGVAGFPDLPSARPITSFGEVVDISSRGTSNYNGFIASVVEHQKYLTAQLNYAYSHTMDEISNGGELTFSSSSIIAPIDPNHLAYNYGNADYDVRHNVTGNYVVNVPYFGGFQIAGTAFWHTGLPFTVTDPNTQAGIGNYFSVLPADVQGHVQRHCGSVGATSSESVGCFAAQINQFQSATRFDQQQRNSFTGPGFFDTDISVLKSFKIPHYEDYTLQLGAQAFNVLNHPNFGQPDASIADKGNGFGNIFSTAGSPTSIYGSELGGDASVRVLQLKAQLNF